jgi:5'-nucleotidase
VDVALQNSGGLRADFNPGPLTKGDVFAVMPFGNLVVTGQLKGADLLAAFENGLSDLSGSGGRFIQLSGARIGYDPAAPSGKRVLWAVLSDGRAVDPNATYTVAANDFQVTGGDGYTSLTRMINPISREQLWEVAANYVKTLGTVNPQVEGRLVAAVAGQPAPTPPVAVTPVLPTPASILPTTVPGNPTAAPAAPTATPVPAQPTTAPPTAAPPTEAPPVATMVLPPTFVPVGPPTGGPAPEEATPVPPGMPTTGTPGSGPDGWLLVGMAALLLAFGSGLLVAARRRVLR